MRILIVEDNEEVARQIKDSLEHELFIADVANDGEEGWFLGDTESYDAVILDIGLPRMDGLSVLKKWRGASNHVPVLMLTSRDTWREKVTGLRAGADDYLAKPFEFEELPQYSRDPIDIGLDLLGGHQSSFFLLTAGVTNQTGCAPHQDDWFEPCFLKSHQRYNKKQVAKVEARACGVKSTIDGRFF